MKKGPLIVLLIIIVIILAVIIGIGLIYLQFTAEPTIPQQTYLKIDIGGSLMESSASTSLILKETPSIEELWYQINRAAIDSRIRGILLCINSVETGFAKMREIGSLITAFRKTKKPVIAFIENGGFREYYLASFADKVILFRSSLFLMYGPAAQAIFFKNTLAKLGIDVEMIHTGEYKTAGNMYTHDRMTPEHRDSIERLLEDIYSSVLSEIAANRRLDDKQLRAWMDETPLPRDEYKKKGMVDDIGYFEDVYAYLKGKFPLTSLKTYSRTTSPMPFTGANKIAVIFASGEIYPGKSGGQSILGGDIMGSDSICELLRSARNQYSVKAVVLRVDSPGGSASASDMILGEAKLLAKKKPLVVSMSDTAASGGYWISMASSKIVAQPQTVTGSIGVISGKFVLKGFYDKIGITKEIIPTTKYAAMYSDYSPFTPAEREKVTQEIREMYKEFVRVVSDNRGMPPEKVNAIGEGRVWSGKAAMDLKLIDRFGGIDDAVDEAKKLARIPSAEKVGVRIYPQKRSLLDLIFDLTGAKIRTVNPVEVIQKQLERVKAYYPALSLPFSLNIR